MALALPLVLASAVTAAAVQPPYVLDLLPAAPPSQQAYHNATLSSCERHRPELTSPEIAEISPPSMLTSPPQGAATP
jgi:hypothetical protein